MTCGCRLNLVAACGFNKSQGHVGVTCLVFDIGGSEAWPVTMIDVSTLSAPDGDGGWWWGWS